jgi:uncharacterized protein (DUF4415 family)
MKPRWVRHAADRLPPDHSDSERLRSTTEDEIAAQAREDGTDFPDDFWDDAVVVLPPKCAISLRVDADVLTWYRAQGKGYQTRMNRVLRRFMEAQQRRAEHLAAKLPRK